MNLVIVVVINKSKTKVFFFFYNLVYIFIWNFLKNIIKIFKPFRRKNIYDLNKRINSLKIKKSMKEKVTTIFNIQSKSKNYEKYFTTFLFFVS